MRRTPCEISVGADAPLAPPLTTTLLVQRFCLRLYNVFQNITSLSEPKHLIALAHIASTHVAGTFQYSKTIILNFSGSVARSSVPFWIQKEALFWETSVFVTNRKQ